MSATEDINDFLDDDCGMRCVAHFSVDGEPLSKARARFTGYGYKARAYTPERTVAGEARIRSAYLAEVGVVEVDPEKAFRVEAVFYNGTRQRRDVDNMIKLVLDGLNKTAWPDDVQVLEVSAWKRFVPRAEARTEVTVFVLDGGMARPTGVCVECGAYFRSYQSQSDRAYCSRACSVKARRLPEVRQCGSCGKSWTPTPRTSTANYCSPECRRSSGSHESTCSICGKSFMTFRSWVGKNSYCGKECVDEGQRRQRGERTSTRFPGRCVDCGSGTTKRSYLRCRACSVKRRRSLTAVVSGGDA